MKVHIYSVECKLLDRWFNNGGIKVSWLIATAKVTCKIAASVVRYIFVVFVILL